MKILVIQQARLGDIYLSWPTIRALRRHYPQGEIHVLVRSRFSAALTGLDAVDRIWHFPSQSLAESLLSGDQGLEEAEKCVSDFLGQLKEQSFDLIANLSFSPLSSYLTHRVSSENSQVRGYTRQADGYLSLPDDASSYFYAQVGPGRVNRYHLADLLAEVAGVSLKEEDWLAPWSFIEPREVLRVIKQTPIQPLEPYILVHVGASEERKCYPLSLWSKALEILNQQWDGQILVVGSAEEADRGEQLCSELEWAYNWCGKSSLPDLFALSKGADLVVGADSVLMHIAALTETPCLNLSATRIVNFWETGPRSQGSRILLAERMEEISPAVVSREIQNLLNKQPAKVPLMERVNNSYVGSEGLFSCRDFSWDLVQAIYAGGEIPILEDYSVYSALGQLNELCELALAQIQSLGSADQKLNLEVIQQVDQLVDQVARRQPEVAPLVSWFKTELIRIGPASIDVVINRTEKVYQNFKLVLSQYCGSPASQLRDNGPKAEF